MDTIPSTIDSHPSSSAETSVYNPCDPNEIIGTKGYDALGDTLQWVATTASLPYTIYFENDPELATAAAQKVEVRHRLHTKADISTFAIGAFGFGSHVFTVEGNRSTYQQRLDLIADLGIYVDVVAGIDIVANEVFWIFQSIDPATGLPPQGTQQGFLPVNDEDHSGEGYVSFTIKPKANACATGDVVTASASIIFDINEAIPTNVWHNTVDALPPTTQLTGQEGNNNEVLLQYSGTDDQGGCGIKQYKLYVSDNYSAYSLYDTYPVGSEAVFPTEYDHCYRFFCLGEDNVGNVEGMKAQAEYEYGNYNLTVSATAYPVEGGTVTGGGAFSYNTMVTLMAIPTYGYEFVGWTNQGEQVSTQATYSFPITENCHLVAQFAISEWVSMDQELHQGWNWFSSYVAYNVNTLNDIEEQLSQWNTTALIKSQNSFTTGNASGFWAGSLNVLDNTQMYMILVDQNLTLTISGAPLDPSAHPITLRPGWNWIAYLSDNGMSLTEATANYSPAHFDIIKSQNQFSTYYEGLGWLGSLNALEPGEGYMYMSNQAEVTSFIYPTPNKEFLGITPIKTFWNTDSHRFQGNMTMMVTLDADQFIMGDGSHEIGAFVNGDCRGSARLQYVDGLNRYVAFLTVGGLEGEEVTFRVYGVEPASAIDGVAEERVTFMANNVIGTLDNPLTLHFGQTGLTEDDGLSQGNRVKIFPNPTNDKVTVLGDGIRSIKISNALGQVVLHKEYGLIKQVELSMSQVGVGVYTLIVNTAYGTHTTKLVVTE